MITFQEHSDPGYALRTLANAKVADLTIAFALDFTTAGEVLTRKCAYGKYLPVSLEFLYTPLDDLKRMAEYFETRNIQSVNIAGNGIYSLKVTQEALNEYMEDYLGVLIEILGRKFSTRNGGQSGMDLAAGIASDRLGLDTTVLAPKGWLYRDASGRDIRDEVAFKKRFGEAYDLSFIF